MIQEYLTFATVLAAIIYTVYKLVETFRDRKRDNSETTCGDHCTTCTPAKEIKAKNIIGVQ